ncbi:MAG: hypothetical protein U0228_23050 [Myxococcaceae bacterium]
MANERTSERLPGVRGGLFGLIALLAPFTWVLEVESCAGKPPVETEYTGTQLFAKFDADAWWVLIPTLVLCVLAPFVAREIARPALKLTVHVTGLLASAFGVWFGAMLLTFAIFSERKPHKVGWLVTVLLVGVVLDALLRLGWSVREWLQSRAAAAAPRGPS